MISELNRGTCVYIRVVESRLETLKEIFVKLLKEFYNVFFQK